MDVVNYLLVEKLKSGREDIFLKCSSVLEALVSAGYDKEQLFKNHWLDFEDHYRAKGWSVHYEGALMDGSGRNGYTFEPSVLRLAK